MISSAGLYLRADGCCTHISRPCPELTREACKRSKRGSTNRIRGGRRDGRAGPSHPPERAGHARNGGTPGERRQPFEARRTAPPIGFPEFIPVLRRVGNHGGDLSKRGTGAAIAMRKQPAELVHRVDRIEPDQTRIPVHPGARVETARPAREVVALERLEPLTPHTRGRADVFEPKAFALTVKPKYEDFLSGHAAAGRPHDRAERGATSKPPRYRTLRLSVHCE